MNLHKLYLTKNDCYRAGVSMKPKGIMVHSTGCNNPNLRRYVGPDDGLLGPSSNHWNQPQPDGRKVCVLGDMLELGDQAPVLPQQGHEQVHLLHLLIMVLPGDLLGRLNGLQRFLGIIVEIHGVSPSPG